jgi:hypothetical protein
MLDSKKGVAVGTVIKLILAILVGSAFVSVTSIGPLGNALQDSFNRITGQIDFTAEIRDKKELSQLAMFVRDRSRQCKYVRKRNKAEVPSPYQGEPGENIDGKGYPALSHVEHLRQKPDCVGGKASPLRETTKVYGKQEDFMPGTLSRERFEIKKKLIIEKKSGSGGSSTSENWIDYNFNSISKFGPEKLVYNSEYSDQTTASKFQGTGSNYVLFFKNSTVAEERSNLLLQNPPNPSDVHDQTNDQNYNYERSIWKSRGGASVVSVGSRYSWVPSTNSFRTQLCPGDEGYIQRNLGVPHNTGVRSAGDNMVNYYPMIVITDTEKKNCGDLQPEFKIESVETKYLEANLGADNQPPRFKFTFRLSKTSESSGKLILKSDEATYEWDNDDWNPLSSTGDIESEVEHTTNRRNSNFIVCDDEVDIYIENSEGIKISDTLTVDLSERFSEQGCSQTSDPITIQGIADFDPDGWTEKAAFKINIKGGRDGIAVLANEIVSITEANGYLNDNTLGELSAHNQGYFDGKLWIKNENQNEICNSKSLFILDRDFNLISNIITNEDTFGSEHDECS